MSLCHLPVELLGAGGEGNIRRGAAHAWPQGQLTTGVMATSEIPPQMANFQTFFLKDLFFLSGLFLDTLHTAILC